MPGFDASRLLRRLGKQAALWTPGLRAVVRERDELRWRIGHLAATTNGAEPGPAVAAAAPDSPAHDKWFWDHYAWAVERMAEFLAAGGVSLTGKQVADVGCGDGIIDLGVAHRLRPAHLVCFDVRTTDVEKLLARAASQGVAAERLPEGLEFRTSAPTRLPADDAQFDAVFSWSAFEHIGDPIGVMREIRRVLRPGGVFFLQLWPFFHSQHGSHLQDWFPDGFVHLFRDRASIEAGVRAGPERWPGEREFMLSEFADLNRITLDDLHRCLLVAGFTVTRAELIGQPFPVPPELARRSLSLLGISGVNLIALRAGPDE